MLLHTAPCEIGLSRYFSMPLCPQCGDMLLAPEKSQFAGNGRVRHLWSCESCGYAFRTAVEFSEA
jgi:DNA-directed RNA polymerase subunit M/transcription elongation factor TFIIS